MAENLERAVTQWQGKSRVNIYFDQTATPAQIQAVGQYLAARGELSTRRFVSREVALARFRSYFKNARDLVGQLDENPFPPSYEVEVSPETVQSSAFHKQMNEVRSLAGVEQVQYDWEWLERLHRLVNIVNLIGVIAGGVLAIAAAFTIANVIRLTMMLYREEIDIMRLVGATERLIRGPFLFEGILQGTIGGLLAVLLLFILFVTAKDALAPSRSLLWSFLFTSFLPWQKALMLVMGGMFAGWFGSWLSVRERTEET